MTYYGYDADDRLVSVSYQDGTPTQSYSYDAVGNLTQAASGNVVIDNFSYDANNRPSSSNVQIDGLTYPFGYSYDLAGDLKTETYPSGRVMSTNYDIAQRPTTLSGSAAGVTTPYVQQTGYWPHGAVYYWQYANNVWPVDTYTKLLQPLDQYSTVANSGNNWLLYLGDNYNSNGTMGSISEGYGPSVSWSNMTWFTQPLSYDSLNRLTGMADGGFSRTFQYDAFGNMSVSGNLGVPLSGLTPTSLSDFSPTNNRLNSASYADIRGNMTTLGAVTMSYDGESRQTQTSDTGTGQTITYTYDALGQRVQKLIANGATTMFVHDAFGQLAAEYNSAGVTPACVICYLSYDHLGSVRLITDQNANVVARYDYLPFGEEIPNGMAGRNGNFGSSANITQMFTGQERDGGTATLDYFQAPHERRPGRIYSTRSHERGSQHYQSADVECVRLCRK